MEPDSRNVPRRSLTEILYVIFLRTIALLCFWFGLQYWAMLVGYSLNGMARFDLLNLPWRVAASSLAVLFPVASLGLWLTVSWGPVVWTLATASQISMYTFWPEIFGQNRLVSLMHGFVAALYIVFRLSLWVEMRRKSESVTVD